MAGSLRERRPGVWEMRVSAGWDPGAQRYRYVSRTFRGTKGAAQKALNALSVEGDAGLLRGSDTTLEALLERWLEVVADDLSPRTIYTWRSYIDRHVIPALGNKPLRKLSAQDLDALYRSLRQSGRAPATVRQIHAVIRRALRQGKRWGLVRENVALDATIPSLRKPEIHSPDPETVRRIIEAAEAHSPEFGAFVFLAAATGARRGELCALRWADLDLLSGVLTIAFSVGVVPGGEPYVKDTKTHKVRRVTLDATILIALSRHHDWMAARARQGSVGLAENAFLFSDEPDGSKPWNPDLVSSTFRRLRDELGLGNVRLHDLRHFHASMLADAAIPIAAVSQRQGHARTSTTSDMYVHAVHERDRQAAEVIGALLSPKRDDGAPE